MIPALHMNRLHYPVTTLGYGKRIGIWFQGCSIHCPGCLVPDSWVATDEHLVPLAALYATLERWIDKCEGITISGGEPFDQPKALAHLLEHLRARTQSPTLDLLIYSGYTFARLQKKHAAILKMADVIVSGPFVEKREDPRPFVGSANQEIHLLTELAKSRYANADQLPRGFTVDYSQGTLFLAGVPKRGEIEHLTQRCRDEAASS